MMRGVKKLAELCYNLTSGYHECKVWEIVGEKCLDCQKGDSLSLSLRYERPIEELDADASARITQAQQEAVEHVSVGMSVIGRIDYVNSHELICQAVHEGKEYRAEVFVSDGLRAGSVKFLSLRSPYGFE